MTIPDTDRIKAATVEARQGGCQLGDLIDWWTKGWKRVAELERAFDDQTRELEIACEVMTPDQLTEFRHRAYPALHPRPVTLISSNPESWLGA